MDQVTTYARSRSLSCRKLDDELIVPVDDGSAVQMDAVFGMNPVAELVWETVASKESNLASIVEIVCREFEVAKDVATADVMAFLDELVAMKAVQVNPRALD